MEKNNGKVVLKKKGARIKYSQGLTLSKNYQSWRVDAGIEVDCEVSEIAEKFEEARKKVEGQLNIAVDENKEVLGDLSKVVE